MKKRREIFGYLEVLRPIFLNNFVANVEKYVVFTGGGPKSAENMHSSRSEMSK